MSQLRDFFYIIASKPITTFEKSHFRIRFDTNFAFTKVFKRNVTYLFERANKMAMMKRSSLNKRTAPIQIHNAVFPVQSVQTNASYKLNVYVVLYRLHWKILLTSC